jgi:cob(I)alamin adenosyltransferase
MGHRLTKIATRTGDAGETGLGDGKRVAKDAARIEALGDIDELNSALGLLLTEKLPADIGKALLQIQHDLFDLGGETSIPGYQMVTEAHVLRLDGLLAAYNKRLPALKEFILPGGTRAAAVARAICRRAERRLVALGRAEPIGAHARQYLNRLSDLLFVLGRSLNRAGKRGDVLWRHVREPKGRRSPQGQRKPRG